MTTETTSRRPETTAGELTTGQHINLQANLRPYRVDHTYRVETGQVLVLLTPVGGGEPISRIWHPSLRVMLVTADELAELEAAARRDRLVAALRQLADDIEDNQLPVPRYRLSITGALGPYAELEQWAAYLDAPIRAGGSAGDISVVDCDVEAGGGPVLGVHMQTSDPAPAVEPEHAHVGGVIGGPGENEAECACGLVFGGFDSQASALEFLNRHIANPQGTETTSDGAR